MKDSLSHSSAEPAWLHHGLSEKAEGQKGHPSSMKLVLLRAVAVTALSVSAVAEVS